MSYVFDADFQGKIAALAIRDAAFNIRTESLIKPEYFNDESEAVLVAIHQRYWEKYRAIPSLPVVKRLLQHAFDNKIVRADKKDDVKAAFARLMKTDISDRDFVVDEVASFAKHQAIINAMGKAVDLLDKRDFEKIEAELKASFDVGANEDGDGMDLFADIEARSRQRIEESKGLIKRGVTTGIRELDKALYNNGWGYKELSVLMGGAKAGKSFALMNFGVNAARAGFNVLHVSLENSAKITADRADAYLTGIKTNTLLDHISAVEGGVAKIAASSGVYKLHAYAPGVFSPSDLRRLIERYRAKGVTFQLIVVDYWDIMRPDQRYRDDKISESKSIGEALRAIAVEENAAVLTAIQANREGFKAHTAGAEHAAEDFNKIRLADIVISINADDDERANNQARLFFAAGRNQADRYTMHIEQDLSIATFVKKVLTSGGL